MLCLRPAATEMMHRGAAVHGVHVGALWGPVSIFSGKAGLHPAMN